MAVEFVRVRLVRISGQDLNLFDFDYDLTWAAFFLNADEAIYGRYGGRDASGADRRLSLKGLRYALEAALAVHREGKAEPAVRPARPLLAEDSPAARRWRRGECIHCHQVYEFRRADAKANGGWRPDDRWVYPLPENVGLTLEVDVGNRVGVVKPGSPADRLGLRAGDYLVEVNGVRVASFADAQYGLHRAPAKGQVPVSWRRDGQVHHGRLELADGWRKTNVTWRPSLLDILPSLTLYGDDLGAEEKKALGLAPKRLAFRQDKPVPTRAKAAGLQEEDVIVGIDDLTLEMTVTEFLGYVRRNYLVGDRITLNVLRNGKPVRLTLTLR